MHVNVSSTLADAALPPRPPAYPPPAPAAVEAYTPLGNTPLQRPTIFSGTYAKVPSRVRRVQDVAPASAFLDLGGNRLLSGLVAEMMVFIDEETSDKPPLNPVDACMNFLVEAFDCNPERMDNCMFYILTKKMHVKAILEWRTGKDLLINRGHLLTAGVTHRMCFPANVQGQRPPHQFRVHVLELAANVSVRFANDIIDALLCAYMQQETAGTMLDSFFFPAKWTKGDKPWGLDDMTGGVGGSVGVVSSGRKKKLAKIHPVLPAPDAVATTHAPPPPPIAPSSLLPQSSAVAPYLSHMHLQSSAMAPYLSHMHLQSHSPRAPPVDDMDLTAMARFAERASVPGRHLSEFMQRGYGGCG